MKFEEKKFRLRGTESLLGGVPLNKEIYSKYIATKGKTDEEKFRGYSDVNNVVDVEESVTGFYRDEEGRPILKMYQIKGFLKAAAKALKAQIELAQSTSKIDNLVFFAERDIPIMRDGNQVKDVDGFLERPLRAETAQGPRVALAKSEKIDGDWYIDITIRVLENNGSSKSKALTMSMVEDMLEYGQFKGLAQWRNGGFGTFVVEEL